MKAKSICVICPSCPDFTAMQDKEMGEINYLAYQAVSELYSSAPFIQEDIYNDFLNIYEMSRKLLVQWGEEQKSSTNETKNDVCEAKYIRNIMTLL